MDIAPPFSFADWGGKPWQSRDALGNRGILLLLLPDQATDALDKTPALFLQAFSEGADALRAASIEPVALISPRSADALQKGSNAARMWPNLTLGRDVEPIRAMWNSSANQAALIFIDQAGFWRRAENLRSVSTLAALLPRVPAWAPQIKLGEMAPDFSVTTDSGRAFRLSDLRGQKNLLLTFFPKCFTGGCTNHLSSLRDRQTQFDESDTEVVAVSVDEAEGPRGQIAFAARWGFEFPMVPDTSRNLCLLYGAATSPSQLAARMSVVIDKSGIVRWITRDVHVKSHGDDALAMLRELGLRK